ncbi:MAG: hypothetical protein ACOCW6_04210 [Spirochaetota bacterium]
MKQRIALGSIVLAILLFGCASGPESTGPTEVPDWVLGAPPQEAGYAFFVGAGTDDEGRVVSAEESASLSMIDSIVRYLGVEVTSQSTAEARATLDDFEAEVNQQIRQESEARLEGFQLVDRFVDRRGESVTVYLLGRYEERVLEAERRRLRGLFEEQIALVEEPADEARRLLSAGDYFQAAQKYLDAAAAAASSNIRNADVKFTENIRSAREVVSSFEFVKQNDDLSTFVAEPFTDRFVAQLRRSDNGRPVPNARIVASYRERLQNGRMGIRTASLRTDADGYVSFAPAPPRAVGEWSLTMSLDLTDQLSPLDAVRGEDARFVDDLRDSIASQRTVFSYQVLSRSRSVPTGVLVADTDIAGNILGSNTTAAGVVQFLTDADFNVQLLPVDSRLLLSGEISEVVRRIRSEVGGSVDRVILGVVGIEEFEEADGVLVKVSGSVSAVDLDTETVLYSTSTFQRSRGNSANSAISAAFRSMGLKVGEEMANNLP